MTGEQPTATEKPVSHASTITLALAIVALAASGAGMFAAGKAQTQLDTVAARQREHRVEFDAHREKQAGIDRGQDIAISGQAKDLQSILHGMNRIENKMEKWEERGFVRTGGGRQ